MAVDIGSEATDRPAEDVNPNYTFILSASPASKSGIITSVDVWATTDMSGLKIATFYRPDPSGHPNNFTARAVQTIGDVTAGSKQTIPNLSIAVEIGDYIGFIWTGGSLDAGTSFGDNIWWKSGDRTDCDDFEFSITTDNTRSVGGYITTPIAGSPVVPAVVALDLI